jgi:hypothetical protein
MVGPGPKFRNTRISRNVRCYEGADIALLRDLQSGSTEGGSGDVPLGNMSGTPNFGGTTLLAAYSAGGCDGNGEWGPARTTDGRGSIAIGYFVVQSLNNTVPRFESLSQVYKLSTYISCASLDG